MNKVDSKRCGHLVRIQQSVPPQSDTKYSRQGLGDKTVYTTGSSAGGEWNLLLGSVFGG
jgi:hypothetical protein